MNFKSLVALALMIGFTHAAILAQKNQVIIVEEYIDENGEKQTKKTVKEWDSSEEMDDILRDQLPEGFDIDEFLHKDGNTIIMDPDGLSQFFEGSEYLFEPMGKERPFLGIRMTDSDEGVKVMDVVEDSPAQTAGLEEGDIILSIDGEAIGTANEVVQLISKREINDVVSIEYQREGKDKSTEAIIAGKTTNAFGFDNFSDGNSFQFRQFFDDENRPRWGQDKFQWHHGDGWMSHMDLDKPRLGATVQNHPQAGVEVLSVKEGSVADKSGLKQGDVIKQLGNIPVDEVDDLVEALDEQTWDQETQIDFERNDKLMTANLKFEKPKEYRPKKLRRL